MKSADSDSWIGRIGLLTPHSDLIPELEFSKMAPAGVSVHAGRVPFGVSAGATVVGADAARAIAEPPYVDEATELLAAAPIDVIVFGFTSSSYISGAMADTELKMRLEEKSNGIPIVIPCAAAVLALRQFEINSMALINPPWFPEETDSLGARYFEKQGIEVVYHAPADLEFGELPTGQIGIEPNAVHDWVKSQVPEKAEAIFIGGNGFRAIGAIESLEKDIGRPVLTANQVAFWQALRISNLQVSVTGYGQIFEN